MSIIIRPISLEDKAQWEHLWRGYQAFYNVEIPGEATNATWFRFFNTAEPVNGLVAERNGKLSGLAHYIFHRSTWAVEPICYLQDLFTAEEARRKGIGGRLIEAVYEQAKAAKANRVYWNTHETNSSAMILYDKVAERSGFLQYKKQLG